MDLEDGDISLELPKMEEKQSYNFKIAILGDESVGKTSLLRRFIDKTFKENYKATIGVSVLEKTYKLSDNVAVNLHIWDLSGQLMFKNIRKTYLEGTHSAIIVFDLTRPETYEHLENWLQELKNPMKLQKKYLIMLIGNKNDLERNIDFEVVKNFAKRMNIPYLETSAKTGDNVDKAFGALCYYLIKDSLK